MQKNLQDIIVQEFNRLLKPIVVAANDPDERDELFKAIGWDIESFDPASVSSLNNLLGGINLAYTTFNSIIQTPPQTIAEVLQLIDAIEQLIAVIKQLETMTGNNLMSGFSDLGRDLIDHLTTNYLQLYQPIFFEVLVCLGLIQHKEEDTNANYVSHSTQSSLVRTPVKRHRLQLNNISSLLNSPEQFLKTSYLIPLSGNWQTNAAATDSGKIIFGRLGRLLSAMGIEWSGGYKTGDGSNFGPTGNAIAEDSMVIRFSPDDSPSVFGVILSLSSAVRGDLGLVVTPFGVTAFDYSLGKWDFSAKLSAAIPGFAIGHYGFEFLPNIARVGAELNLYKQPNSDGVAFLFGSTTGSRLEIGEVEIVGAFELSSSLKEYSIGIKLHKASFVVSPGDGDGFLQKILPANGLQGEFDLKIMWSNVAGFHFEGAGSLELLIPIHKTILNALTIDSMIVSAKVDSSIKLITAISGNLKLGPFNAVFDEVGMQFDVDFPANKDGNLGALDVDLGFKPPKGLGLSIKSDTVTGAGFLSFDKDKGRYVGALELTIKKQITIKIIGILTTKLPNNQPGYSLLLVVTVEGFKPIQLGFGFTLNGVGGLIALHRRMNTEELRKGVRNNTIDNILFPTNPVENINSIISSLETVFPIEEGRYSFGPMAIIGWGTPTLITAELGLFFEMPNPQEFALIGVIRAVLPDENKALLRLQIAFAGIISFDKKLITFDASLFDSSLLGMTLSGDMAFRLKWGDQPTFVLTVGGFHPKFTVPQLYLPPNMTRLTMNLSGGDNPRLTLSTYFAVTSNTAQFGASVDFNWEISDKIDISGYLGFDALFFFSPFRFTATIQGGLDVKWKGDSKVSLSFSGTLEGPTPWFIRGSVSFKIFGVSYSKSLNKQIGGYQHTLVEDINVLPLLTAALQDKKNWQSTMSQDTQLLVTVREFPTNPGDLIIHPQGSIAVSQKVVPLDVTFSRFGNRRATVYNRFSIAINYLQNNATGLAKTDLKEYFAPNEFYSLSEDQRLARESFELMTSGAKVTNTSNALTSGAYHQIKQEYETIYMDSRYKPVRYSIKSLIDDTTYYSMRAGGSAASSPLGSTQSGRSSAGTPAVTVSGNSFAIAQTHNLAHYNNLTAGSETEALVLLESILETNPELEGKLNVIHAFELA